MSALVGLDLGTGGARAVALDERGNVVSDASAAYPLHSPRPGWAEQDPADWWDGAKEVLGRVAAEVGGDVAGIGLTGQMHGSVFLDASDGVIRPALLWNDQRTHTQCEEITDVVGAGRLIELSGNPALTGFQAPKVVWLREEEPENFARVARVLLPKDYARLLLTGEHATDVSDASGTLFLDVKKRDWSGEILDALEIPHHWMPEVYEGPEVAGTLRGDIADELGLPVGVPVAAGGGDNAAAAVGTGIVSPGLVSSSVGTSGVLFAHTSVFEPDPSGRLHAFCHAVPGAYHLMAVTLSAGGSLGWWRDRVGEATVGGAAGGDFDELVAAASKVPPGSEGLVFLPYLSGERTPHLDPRARGAFFGLTTRHDIAHMTRAVMEGVAFSLRDGLEIMRSLDVPVGDVRATGGGARSALWRSLQADVYGEPIRRTVADEGPAYGAALLAGVSCGVYADVGEATGVVRLRDEETEPHPERAKIYEDYYEVYRSLYPGTKEAMSRLTELAAGAEIGESE